MNLSPASSSDQHAHHQALMPWVLNGRATPDQRAALTAHLAQCSLCRAEMARQKQLQAALQLPAAAAPDAELGLARLMQRLDSAAERPAQPDPAAAAVARPPRFAGQRLSLALAACVALQAVALAMLAPQVWRTPGPGDYLTLSQPAESGAAQLRVVPAPEMSLAAWQALLEAERLQVTAGPNRAGAYALQGRLAPQEIPALLARLRQHPQLRLVEALRSDQP